MEFCLDNPAASSRLPLAEFPLDLRCPACGKGPFKTEGGLRGHAHGSHKILWENRPERKGKDGKDWKKNLVKIENAEDPILLKPWQRLALIRNIMYNETLEESARHFNRSVDYLKTTSCSKAGKAFRAEIEEILGNPVQLLKIVLAQSSLGLHEDQMAALEWAKENKDYNSVHRIIEDLWNRVPELREGDAKAAPQELHLHLSTDALTIPEVKTSYEAIEIINAEFQLLGPES